MAGESKELVRFGLKNTYYALWDASTGEYKTPVKMPGAVSLNISPEGDSTTFYADDKPYFAVTANGGYTGTLEIAAVTDDMLVDLLGYVKDANGALVEDADAQPASFALLFEVGSNLEDARFAMYNCTVARPSVERKTKESSIDVSTESLEFTAIGRELPYGEGGSINAVKSHLALTEKSKAEYGKFFSKVYLPSKAAA